MRHVVFRHRHIAPPHFGSLESGQAHVVLGSVRPSGDDLRRGMTRSGIFQLVLHRLEEILRDPALTVVVHRKGENLLDLLIDPLFAGPNVPDAFQQLIKVVGAEFPGIAQPLVIEDKALLHILGQHIAGPPAEVDAHVAPYPVAHGQNHIEIVEFYVAANLPGSFHLNL